MNKFAIFGAISCLVLGLLASGFALDCSRIVEKESEGVLNYLAMVNFTVPISTDENGWLMTFLFDEIFTGIGVWDVWVSYNGTEKYATMINRNSSDAKLVAGDHHHFRFRINYGREIPNPPHATSIRFQAIELCD